MYYIINIGILFLEIFLHLLSPLPEIFSIGYRLIQREFENLASELTKVHTRVIVVSDEEAFKFKWFFGKFLLYVIHIGAFIIAYKQNALRDFFLFFLPSAAFFYVLNMILDLINGEFGPTGKPCPTVSCHT
jgi:hypothetical protein